MLGVRFRHLEAESPKHGIETGVETLLVVRSRLSVVLGGGIPIDDLEERIDEAPAVGTVVVVVRVLPDVEREHWVCAPERAVVVLVDREVAQLVGDRVVDEQRPARGGRRRGLELALPALIRAEVLGDPVGQLA